MTFLFIKKSYTNEFTQKKSNPVQSILKLHPPSLNTIRTRQGITKVYMQNGPKTTGRNYQNNWFTI